MPLTHQFDRDSILFGAAYYAEYHQTDRIEKDLDLMVDAGFSVIRVGESVWSTWEPRDGVFNLDWLEPVLDGAHRRGIHVILGTPTYAVPPWLQVLHPEIAAERETGKKLSWGSRQEVDFTHPVFKYFADRVIRKVVARYSRHPAVIGYQVDNEPGLELFHNHAVFIRFVHWLENRYGDVETLNREWGLTYWSHRLAHWSELWTPDGNSLPQYDLEWRRFQAIQTTEFIAWQAGIVREYALAEQFVTTCLAYPRPAVDDGAVTASLDVTAGNPYYAMQDHLDFSRDAAALTPWTTSGVGGLFRQADRLFSSKQARFLVTETDAQSIGGSFMNLPPWPGQLEAAALALISRGAAMIEYWHWHTLPYGTETYWGGVLPHSLEPGRIYDEVSHIGHLIREMGDEFTDYEPDADVGLLWSNDSRWALEFFPNLGVGGSGDRASYEHMFDAFYTGVVESGAQARILHVQQAADVGAKELARRYPTLVVPGLYVAADAELDMLTGYAHAGGHLVVGPRTAYGDHLARARVAVAPDRLREASGVIYEEYSNLEAPVAVTSSVLDLAGDCVATAWIDGLLPEGAEAIAAYAHPQFGRFPTATTHQFGAGRVTVVGTVPSRDLARALMRWAVPIRASRELVDEYGAPVTVSSGRLPGGDRGWFLINWSGQNQSARLAAAAYDVSERRSWPVGTRLPLRPWESRVLRTACPAKVDEQSARSGLDK